MNVTSFITYFSHSFLVLQNLTGTSAVRILLCQLTAHSNSSIITTHTHFCLWNSRLRYTCQNKPVTFSGFFPTVPLLLRKAFHTLHWKQEYFQLFPEPSSFIPLPRCTEQFSYTSATSSASSCSLPLPPASWCSASTGSCSLVYNGCTYN